MIKYILFNIRTFFIATLFAPGYVSGFSFHLHVTKLASIHHEENFGPIKLD